MIPLEWFGWSTICGNSLAKFENLISKSSIYHEIITSEASRTSGAIQAWHELVACTIVFTEH